MSSRTPVATNPVLRPKVGPWLLTFYGLGTTVGAGIYALIGEVAGVAGYYAPFAFLLSALIAGVSAASFAELSQRLPKTAAAALYVETAFGSKKFALFVGLATALAGIVSSAALVNAFYGYFVEFVSLGRTLLIVSTTLLVTLIAVWGIRESLKVAAAITVVELVGLLLVIAFNFDAPTQYSELLQTTTVDGALGLTIALAAVLAFYAFIGFEDMVDLAEEVRDVERSMPLAIGLTVVITAILYFVLSVVSVTAVSLDEIQSNSAPMALLFSVGGGNPKIVSAIALFAIINGVLVQIIMASRVFYGLAMRQNFYSGFAHINPKTNTPMRATLFSGGCIILFALSAELRDLAAITATLVLCIFGIVNLALWTIKRREAKSGLSSRGLPISVSMLGFLLCLCLLTVQAHDLLT